MNYERIFQRALEIKASDITLCAGFRIVYRLGDKLEFAEPIDRDTFAAVDTAFAANTANHGCTSFTYSGERYRLAAYDSEDGRTLEIRHLRKELIPLEKLNPPLEWTNALKAENGLIIVTGAMGSGKSMTLAASIDHLNQTHEDGLKIITLEDPVEHLHTSNKCLIKQRELRRHFPTLKDAIEATMRHDADIILVGELRDNASIGAALTASATGALVVGTMHTVDAASAVFRVADAADNPDALSMLATFLRAVLATKLVPAIGGGRLAAYELLVNTSPVSACILQKKIANLRDEIARGDGAGMIPMDMTLENLLRAKRITKSTALSYALDRTSFAERTINLS